MKREAVASAASSTSVELRTKSITAQAHAAQAMQPTDATLCHPMDAAMTTLTPMMASLPSRSEHLPCGPQALAATPQPPQVPAEIVARAGSGPQPPRTCAQPTRSPEPENPDAACHEALTTTNSKDSAEISTHVMFSPKKHDVVPPPPCHSHVQDSQCLFVSGVFISHGTKLARPSQPTKVNPNSLPPISLKQITDSSPFAIAISPQNRPSQQHVSNAYLGSRSLRLLSCSQRLAQRHLTCQELHRATRQRFTSATAPGCHLPTASSQDA